MPTTPTKQDGAAERFAELVTEYTYCVTDEKNARPWSNEMAEKTEAARSAVEGEFAALLSEVAALRKALEGLLHEAHAASAPLHHDSEWSIKARAALEGKQCQHHYVRDDDAPDHSCCQQCGKVIKDTP